jgi:hypothetical protein
LRRREYVRSATSSSRLEFVDKITPEMKAKVTAITAFVPRLSEKDFIRELRLHHLKA